jgi:hypothetical protein
VSGSAQLAQRAVSEADHTTQFVQALGQTVWVAVAVIDWAVTCSSEAEDDTAPTMPPTAASEHGGGGGRRARRLDLGDRPSGVRFGAARPAGGV